MTAQPIIKQPTRLGPSSIGLLPASIRRPLHDRNQVTPGILHLGVGAFHRCHQAEYTDDALAAASGPWGIVGVDLRPSAIDATLGVQGGLYCRELRTGTSVDRRLIGSIVGTIAVQDEEKDPGRATLKRALGAAADASIGVITLTVTEKGYCHVPATGALDLDNPDIVHDLAHPQTPVSVPGFILQALALRMAAGEALPAIISCDNVPDNGSTLRRCVLELGERIDPRLAARIERDASFLNTMVDRIVPATSPDDVDSFAFETGVMDQALVIGEPFRMWVLEDRFDGPLPDWSKAGALFVPDVAPYEILKMRVVNGIQSNLCQLGVLSGIDFMADVMAEKCFTDFAFRTIRREVAPNLPPVPGIATDDYIAETARRLTNPALKHRTLQISTDGSQKIKQRLLEPIRAALRNGTPCDGLLLGVAGWMQYASGRDSRGRALEVRDPLSGRTLAVAAASAGDAGALVAGMLDIDAIFGRDLRDNEDIKLKLTRHVAALQSKPSRMVVADFLAANP